MNTKNENIPKKTMAHALLEAQQSVQAVGKDSYNDYSHYDYTSAEAVITEARKCLNLAGLSLARTNWTIGEYIGAGTRIIEQYFLLSHPESGTTQFYSIPFPSQERTGTPLDKAVAASLTSGLAYFLRDLLLMPRSDAEMDRRDDTDHVPQQPKEQHQNRPSMNPQAPAKQPELPPNENWEFLAECMRLSIGAKTVKELKLIVYWVTGEEISLDEIKKDSELTLEILNKIHAMNDSGTVYREMLAEAIAWNEELTRQGAEEEKLKKEEEGEL